MHYNILSLCNGMKNALSIKSSIQVGIIAQCCSMYADESKQ